MEYLTDENYMDILRNVKNVGIFIIFTASWCKFCITICPHFDKLQNINKDAHFYKVDINRSPNMCKFFSIKSLPTVISIRNLLEMDRVEGSKVCEINQLVAKYK